MTQAEAQKQINDEQQKFYGEKYDGSVDVPYRMVELFKKGIMALSSFAHQINFYKVKAIAAKKTSELTNGDIHEMMKVILNTPLEKKYGSYDEGHYDEAEEYEIKIQKFVISYNMHVDDFNKKLEMKMKTLIDLSGGIKPNLNGMKIVSG